MAPRVAAELAERTLEAALKLVEVNYNLERSEPDGPIKSKSVATAS